MRPVIEQHDDEGGVRVAVLNRPPANAIDESLLDALDTLVADVAADDGVRALVLAGEGAFFCGGFDLRAPPRDDGSVAELVALYRSAHRNLLALPKPTVAAVEGHAIAGGLVLALACDHRVLADGDYKIGLNEVGIGAAFPGSAIEIVRLRLSSAAAAELVLDAALHPAGDAVRLGIARDLVAAPTAREEAVRLAARLGSYPAAVYAHAKARLVGDTVARIDAVSMDEELATAALWSIPESREARRDQRRRL